MAELCLMASHGNPPGLLFHPEQGMCRVSKDCQPILASPGARQDLGRLGLNLRPLQKEETWKPMRGLSESDHFVKIDQTISRPVLLEMQGTLPDSVLFSLALTEKCKRHEEIMQFLMSGSSEVEKTGLDLSVLSDLMGLKESLTGMQQQFVDPGFCSCHQDTEDQPALIYPSSELQVQKPLVDFVGDLARSSKLTVHPSGQVSFMGTEIEMKDLLSVVAEFYLSKNTIRHGKQSFLVPHFTRIERADTKGPSLKVETLVAPLKSPEKTKLKSFPKRKNGRKGSRERDLYKKNYFHACESLLSIMMNKRGQRKTAFLFLKKSGPELPELLTHFSTGIAGTGLAVLFSVACKVASGRFPFCASRFLSTGIGFSLVWLAWAVDKLRATVVQISKNTGKVVLKEEEMMKRVDRSVNEILFRAATVMAIAVLRLA